MGDLATQLGGKQAGELIRAADWNGLIDSIEARDQALSQSLDTLRTDLQTRILALQAHTRSLETSLRSLHDDMNVLLAQTRRVALRSNRVRYALGELAEITAQVTDARGNRMNLESEAVRPWVDFVCTWGKLRPVDGYESLAGEGDRTLSVRVDVRGEARVLLRSEYTEGLPREVETRVEHSLTTVLPDRGLTLSQVILQANTPTEAGLRGAFQVLSREYDRAEAVRSFVDTHYVFDLARPLTPIHEVVSHETWRDYRSTVLAFVKMDSDPSTQDAGQGSCSIQITFRNWIRPWIDLDYLAEVPVLAGTLGPKLQNNLGTNVTETVSGFRRVVVDEVEGKGLLGKERSYQALTLALENLPVTQSPAFVRTAAQSVRNAVGLQQTLETAAPARRAGTSWVGLDAITDVAVQTENRSAVTMGEVTEMLDSQVTNLRTELFAEVESVDLAPMTTRLSQLETQVAGKVDQTSIQLLSESFNLRFTNLEESTRNLSTDMTLITDRVGPLLAPEVAPRITSKKTPGPTGRRK